MKFARVFDGCSLAEVGAADIPLNVIAQEKIDGWRASLDGTTGELVGRNSRIGFFGGKVPAGCLFDGELVKENYHAFDLLKFNGQDVSGEPLFFRLQLLDSLRGDFLHVRRATENIPAFARQIESEGGEGIVLKFAEPSYFRGAWTRCKREFTADFTILSADVFKQSAEVAGANGSVGRILGFSETEIIEAKPGRVVEVRAMEFTAAGKLRHGRFVRFRDDKAI